MKIDRNSETMVIKAPVAEVSKAITQLIPQAKVYFDVLDREIQTGDRGVILFQFCGFEWTIMSGLYCSTKLLAQLSKVLQTRSMFLLISEYPPYIGHQIWDNGRSVEHFCFADRYVDENKHIAEVVLVRFESAIREISEADLTEKALEDFYSEQGVYSPDILINTNRSNNHGAETMTLRAEGDFDCCMEQQKRQFKKTAPDTYNQRYSLKQDYFQGFDYVTFDPSNIG